MAAIPVYANLDMKEMVHLVAITGPTMKFVLIQACSASLSKCAMTAVLVSSLSFECIFPFIVFLSARFAE